jgi:hypothetical protein
MAGSREGQGQPEDLGLAASEAALGVKPGDTKRRGT